MKILHAADLHIDSPLRGLDAYEGAPLERMRSATRRAVEKLVDLALHERVDVVTIGGDVFDGPWPDVNTGLWWNRQLDRIVAAGIEVYVVHGNHDAESVLAQRIHPPRGVVVFSADAAETVTSGRLPLAVHGRSYRDRATLDDLASTFPPAVPGVLNVGLLHTSLDGRPGHDAYAPCTVPTLVAKGYDVWGLGHVHEREHLVVGGTHVLFPGNTQGRSVRELGAKGVSVVTTRGASVVDVRHVDVDVVRWVRLEVDVAGLQGEDDLYARVEDAVAAARRGAGRPLAARVHLTGTGPLRTALLDRLEVVRANLVARLTSAQSDVWLEKLVDGTRAERPVGAAETAAVAAVRRLLEEALHDDEAARTLAGVLPDVQRRLAGVLGRLDDGEAPASLTSLAYLRERLPRAAELLIARLEER